MKGDAALARRVLLGTLLLAGVLGCTSGTGSSSTNTTSSSAVTVTPNPTSVVSAIVSFTAPGAVQAQVVSVAATESFTTPLFPVTNGAGSIAVLGLKASTTYSHTVVAFDGSGVATTIGTVQATTPDLPADLATTTFQITPSGGPGPGYLLATGTGPYEIAFDGNGVVRWYRHFDPAATECKMQYDSSFTAYVGSSQGFQQVPGEIQRFTPDGTVTATYTTAPDPTEAGTPTIFIDPHEVLVTQTPQGNEQVHFFGYEIRPAGASATPSAWHCLLRQAPDGTVDFRWKTWEHYTDTDQVETIPNAADVDHTNAIAIDTDGDYIVSLRNMDEIAKIDSTTGDFVWRLGGVHSQFTILQDPLGGFFGQHSIRLLPNGNLLAYDNGLQHSPPETRAVEYALDLNAKTATLVWEFRHNPPIYTPFVGSVERLVSGNTLVAFGFFGTVDEVSPSGTVVWEGQLRGPNQAPLVAYRVRRLPSLYQFAPP